jgi:hypothetical protein
MYCNGLIVQSIVHVGSNPAERSMVYSYNGYYISLSMKRRQFNSAIDRNQKKKLIIKKEYGGEIIHLCNISPAMVAII